MCERGCWFLFLSKFLVLTRYFFYAGISFFPFHVSLTISFFKDSPPCFVINIWESISWVPSHTRDGYALPKITNHFHCVLFCLFFYRVSTLQLLLSRATLLWVMLQRLETVPTSPQPGRKLMLAATASQCDTTRSPLPPWDMVQIDFLLNYAHHH